MQWGHLMQHLTKGLDQGTEQHLRIIQDAFYPNAINTSSFSNFFNIEPLQCSSDILLWNDSIQKVNGWF